MPVDQQIRERMRRTGAGLPEPDTAAALDAVLDRADSSRRRRAALIGVAASTVLGSALVGGLWLASDGTAGDPLPTAPAASDGPDHKQDEGDLRLTRPRDTTGLGLEDLVGPFGAPDMEQVHRWEDAADSPVDGSDIRRVVLRHGGVGVLDGRRYPAADLVLELTGMPPEDTTAPVRDVEYGIVVDRDGDREADCEFGISTDVEAPGQFRVWAVRLSDGRLAEHVAPPSMGPFEFYHPHERTEAEMYFQFSNPMPECQSLSHGVAFYTWAATLQDGGVVSVDYAPDASWLRVPEAVRSEPLPDAPEPAEDR